MALYFGSNIENVYVGDTKVKRIYKGDTLVFETEPVVTLIIGSDFNTKLKEVGPEATSVIFTKTAIPSDKISTASIVSTNDSESKAYMYLDGTTVYISPEDNDTIIYANESCYNMFGYCRNLTSLDLSNFNTSNVTNMNFMFESCSSLTSIIGLENFDTSKVTDMSDMFSYCIDLTSITGLENFNTSKVTYMCDMFYKCNSLTSLNLSNWDTSNVTNMSGMFNYCESLTSITGLENFNTSNVTNMSGMFNYCESLTSITGLENFNTSNVTSMNRMFGSCDKLTSVDVSSFNISNVTNMSGMFNYCNSLTSLDLSNFNTSNVTYMSDMFNGCTELSSIIGIENFNTSKVTDMDYMFKDCPKLSGEITIMNPNITDYYRMFYNCSTDTNAKFIVKYADGCKDMAQTLVNTKSSSSNVYLYTPDAKLLPGPDFNSKLGELYLNGISTLAPPISSDSYNIIFTNTAIPNDKISNAIVVSTNDSESKAYMYKEEQASYIYNIYISPEIDGTTIYANEDSSTMFNNFFGEMVLSIINIDFTNFNTSKVTNMSNMFSGSRTIESLDLSNWDTSNVTDMSGMFSSCMYLTSIIGLENLNTSNVTDMRYMFYMCSRLSGSITIMGNTNIYDDMFYDCSDEYGTKFTVNYKTGFQTLAENMTSTRHSGNVVLGTQV